jgi:arginase
VVSARRPAPEVAVLGAPSSIGLRPDDRTGAPQRVDQAPATLRALRLVERLAASDRGDVIPPPYHDLTRPAGRPRNEPEVARYSHAIGRAVDLILNEQRFLVVVGGDCSVVLGCLLGARGVGSRIGLAYIDAHADFATPQESQTGSAASMALALAVGRGDSILASLVEPAPLIHDADVALVGRRDFDQPSYGHAALARSDILDLPDAALEVNSILATADAVLNRVARSEVDGFWVHVDCDVLNPEVMTATGALEPGGPSGDELAAFLIELTGHPKALGLTLTLYDPSLDHDAVAGRLLVDILVAGARGIVPDR